jgi:Rrf2 family protein
MELTLRREYAIKVLVHLADSGRLWSIRQVAEELGVSYNHLVKVVHCLVKHGFVESVRGRNGGVRLARAAHKITIGHVIRATGTTAVTNRAAPNVAADDCSLEAILQEASIVHMAVLDTYTILDICEHCRHARDQITS